MATNAAASTSTPAKKTAAKKSSASEHPTYKDMISKAITTLKERNGSSRQAIKKYILGKFKVKDNFDVQFNQALRRGVNNGDFVQPKGPAGAVKLAKKDKEAAPKKAAVKKAASKTIEKAGNGPLLIRFTHIEAQTLAAPKKDAPKKKTKKTTTTTTKKDASPKKTATKKATAPKKAATSSEKAPAGLTKTKSGRVTKTKAAPRKRAAPKKAAPPAASK